MSKINAQKLKAYLIDYFGTAMVNGLPMAVIDLSDIESASEEELILIAKQKGIDLSNYIEDDDLER